jgi:hypothetical protein
MGRRLGITLLALALAVAAWWIMRWANRSGSATQGLVVHVQLLDRDGAPVTPAQVLRVFDGGRSLVDAHGRVRLAHVVLRAADRPSPEAFAVALEPLARYHATRRGDRPEATRRPDGSWDVRYRLHRCGLLRLTLRPTILGACRAFPEPDPPLQRWEPVGGKAVVRPGATVDFRVFGGWKQVPVRIQGEADAHGVVAVASRIYFLDVPSPGSVLQKTLTPEPAQPIHGQVALPAGPAPPTLAGTLTVTQIGDDGRRAPLLEVPVAEDGSFLIPTTGLGRYELSASLQFAPEAGVAATRGGESVTVPLPKPAVWCVLRHPGCDLAKRRWSARLTPVPAQDARPSTPTVRPGAQQSEVVLPRPGTWRLELDVAGTRTHPPLAADMRIVAPAAGPHPAEAKLAEVPSGTLVVKTPPGAWSDEVRSARLSVDGRVYTLVRHSLESLEVAHVRAGEQDVELAWSDDGETVAHAHVRVEAGGRTQVTLGRERAHAGGRAGARR